MRKAAIHVLVCLFVVMSSTAHGQKKSNIINYFASNNQIIGVPMVDLENEFRFYPDLSFQNAIVGVEVYYFVLNDVYKNHLVPRQEGRYWEGKLREFSLGESIQRVEVVVDCSTAKLNQILSDFGIDTTAAVMKNDAFQYYLLLRRGDDNNLYHLKYFQNRRIDGELVSKSLNGLTEQNKLLLGEIKELNTAVTNTKIKSEDFQGSKTASIKSAVDKVKLDFTVIGDTSVKSKLAREFASRNTQLKNELVQLGIDTIKLRQSTTNSIEKINNKLEAVDAAANAYTNRFSTLPTNNLPTQIRDPNQELLSNIPQDPSSRLYYAYVESRIASMLDMKYKQGSKNQIMQFNYRNDKQSLQYLQADDPQEKLGIFRARLVPFPFYATTNADGTQSEFKWQQGKVIYEIGINFGYAVVKGDHFVPKFFDMNRLGLGIGISADTFSQNPTFLSVSLTYDMNTYTSISFGANLIDKPSFYMGVGINARAFKDLVKNSATLFK